MESLPTIQPADALMYMKEKLCKYDDDFVLNDPKWHMTGHFGEVGTQHFVEFEVTYSDATYNLSFLTRNVKCISYSSDDIVDVLNDYRGIENKRIKTEDTGDDFLDNILSGDDIDLSDPDFKPEDFKEDNIDISKNGISIKGEEIEEKKYFPKNGKRLKRKLKKSLSSQAKELITCDYCELTFTQRRINCFRKHMFKKHNFFNGELVKPEDREAIKQTHFRPKWKCEICTKEFSLTSKFKSHMETEHNIITKRLYSKPKEVMCPFCGKLHGTAGQKFADHLKCYHGEEDLSQFEDLFQRLLEEKKVKEKTVCTVCGVSVSSLYLHMRTHNKDLHPCTKCGQRFANANSLWRHTKYKHGEDQKTLCSDCGDEFVNQYRLRRHQLRVHIKKKDFQCSECDKSFFAKDKLSLHITSVHRKEKRFPCDYCQFRCARIDNLNLHRRKSHSATYKLKLSDMNKIIQNGANSVDTMMSFAPI